MFFDKLLYHSISILNSKMNSLPAVSNNSAYRPIDQDLPKVAILLCTYHGQHYLADQLDSFAAQSHSNWKVWASDDGSQDDTHAILETYRQKWGDERVTVYSGPAEGFAVNFLSLTREASIDTEYYAFSDQDDIWEADKLSRSLAWLETIPKNTPALYCSRTRYIDQNGNYLGLSNLFSKSPSFRNALVQNIAGGNTMVFNKAARDLIKKTQEHAKVAFHDWWVYLLVTGCGGCVFYDKYPGVLYRQHANNLAGQNVKYGAHIARVKALLVGRFRDWNDTNLKVLDSLRHELTVENCAVMDTFSKARKQSLIPRLINIHRSGVYRQTPLGNIGLFIAAVLRRL